MNINEFSDQFDTLLDSYKFNNIHGTVENPITLKLDEYEKSVYLTNAQKDLVVGLYNGTIKPEGYEGNEELRRYLDVLNKEKEISITASTSDKHFLNDVRGFTEYAIPKYREATETLPEIDLTDMLFITYEAAVTPIPLPTVPPTLCSCGAGVVLQVVPTRRDDIHVYSKNPFRNNKVFRIDDGNKIILASKEAIDKYIISYIKRPKPIILVTLTEPLSIDGTTSAQTSDLDESLHHLILQMAVQAAYTYMATQPPQQNNNNRN